MVWAWVHVCSRKEGKIQVMAGPAPSSQTVGSLMATPMPTKPARKKWQKVVWLIHFNGEILRTTFD
jgi:hypothetical protein